MNGFSSHNFDSSKTKLSQGNPRMSKKYLFTGFMIIAILVAAVFSARAALNKEVAFSAEGKIKGSPSAPIKISTWSDFQCPSCALEHKTIHQFMEAHPDAVQLKFNHFPLRGHQHSRLAHISAECAYRLGNFWPYHDKLYDNQDKWAPLQDPKDTFIQYAEEIGLPKNDFVACLSDVEAEKAVLLEKIEGAKLQIERTPTLFVNNERLVGGVELEAKLNALLPKEGEKSGGGPAEAK